MTEKPELNVAIARDGMHLLVDGKPFKVKKFGLTEAEKLCLIDMDGKTLPAFKWKADADKIVGYPTSDVLILFFDQDKPEMSGERGEFWMEVTPEMKPALDAIVKRSDIIRKPFSLEDWI